MILTRFCSLSSTLDIVLATLIVLVASSCSKKSSSQVSASNKINPSFVPPVNPRLNPSEFIPEMSKKVMGLCSKFNEKIVFTIK